MEPVYVPKIGYDLTILLDNAIYHARIQYERLNHTIKAPIDIRVFYQKWTDPTLGFLDAQPIINDHNAGSDIFVATFVIKFSPTFRAVYFAGKHAYNLTKKPTLNYYDAVRLRRLPGQKDLLKENLNE